MKLDVKDLVAQLALIRRHAATLSAMIDELETDLHAALTVRRPDHPVGPVSDPVESAVVDGCKCPPNQRVAAPVSGSPRRTVCRVCKKEHD